MALRSSRNGSGHDPVLQMAEVKLQRFPVHFVDTHTWMHRNRHSLFSGILLIRSSIDPVS